MEKRSIYKEETIQWQVGMEQDPQDRAVEICKVVEEDSAAAEVEAVDSADLEETANVRAAIMNKLINRARRVPRPNARNAGQWWYVTKIFKQEMIELCQAVTEQDPEEWVQVQEEEQDIAQAVMNPDIWIVCK